jgi:hypothetical protein
VRDDRGAYPHLGSKAIRKRDPRQARVVDEGVITGYHEPLGRVAIVPNTSASDGRTRGLRQPPLAVPTFAGVEVNIESCRNGSPGNQCSLVANNLQLQFFGLKLSTCRNDAGGWLPLLRCPPR